LAGTRLSAQPIHIRLRDKAERARSSHAIAQAVLYQLTPLANEHDAHIGVVERRRSR
jgi:hypothetical protein